MSGESSDSDFVEDPDEIEVPGGGKDLSSLFKRPERPQQRPMQMPSRQQMQLPVNILQQNMASGAMPMMDLNMLLKMRDSHEFKNPHELKMLLPNMFQLPTMRMEKGMAGSQQPGAFLAMSEESHEEEGMGVAETYADYKPRKVLIGVKHPDPVVESTSLAGVEPANVHYKVMIPQSTISSGALSSLQLESIHYACQQHERTLDDGSAAGFLIGDGAGVGKGRTIAGIIFENYLRKRKKSIWISVIGDLKYDCERDLKDIGAPNIKVYSLNKMKYTKISSEENGSIKKGVIFCTYSSLIAKTNQAGGDFLTRFQQLLEWCTPEFDGVIVFDECHRAKNLAPAGNSKPTKTGMAVLDIQKRLPKAKIVYASATGATEPRNMAYMIRLGLWGRGTAFQDFPKFLSAMEIRGVGAMEILAMEMKQRGMYIARQLSFHGVSFKVVEVPLTEKCIKVYDRSAKLWAEALEAFKEASVLLSTDKTVLSSMWSLFWSAHQRFFKCLCIAAKVKEAVSISREAIKCGKCVVIGLQSTGEARLLEQIQKDEGLLNDFVSSAKGILETLVEKHFPTDLDIDLDKVDTSILGETNYGREKRKGSNPKLLSKRRKIMDNLDDFSESEGETEYYDEGRVITLKTSDNRKASDSGVVMDKSDADKRIENRLKAAAIKKNLLMKIKKLGKKLPPNALDDLIDELGGPENVAEMTGRKGRVVHSDKGFHYESRTESDVPLDLLNIAEKQRFMNGEKDVAIISEVASSGISLHSDRRAMNRKRRVHITLELPWSADRAIQQFGRTHRSNQASAPEYVFLISDLAGERRFASVVAKRLESLGALTHGDRRATESRDLSRFNIDNKYGRTAMEVTLKTLVGQEAPRVPFPKDYPNNFVKDACEGLESVGLLTKLDDGTFSIVNERRSLGRFLNRILGLTVTLQNCLFDYFTATMDAVIGEAKKLGSYDVGILDLAGTESNVKRIGSEKFKWNNGNGEGIVELHKLLVERGMAWAQALSIWQGLEEGLADFWLSVQSRGGRREVLLAERVKTATKPKRNLDTLFIIYRPNIGEQVKRETLGYLESKYCKAGKGQVEGVWKEHYEGSAEACSHMYWGGRCPVRSAGEACDHGRRQRLYHVISGSVLGLWPTIQAVIQNRYGSSSRLQVVRVSASDGAKIVGTLIPNPCVAALRNTLADVAKPRIEHQSHQNQRAGQFMNPHHVAHPILMPLDP